MEAALLPAEAGFEFADADMMSEWAHKQYLDKYSWKDEDGEPTEVWPDTSYRVVRHELGALGYTDHDWEFRRLVQLITERIVIPGGRKLAQAGRQYHQTNNCFLYRCRDSREGWFQELLPKCGMALSSGGGIGVVYSDVRPYGTRIRKTGGIATGPLTPANMVNDAARRIIGGGNRRAAIWAGLHWNHPDIFSWIVEKDWPDYVKDMKRQAVEEGKDQDVMAPLDMTNISVILDNEFFEAYRDEAHSRHDLAHEVYWKATAHMVAHGEPGFSIDCGENEGENLRNACTEITSADDSDVCNLGSINMARVETLDEFREVVRLATLFLIAGTVYSDIPHDEVRVTREKNRRLGLGLMGLHEWLLVRGYRYEMVPELREWLEVYAGSTEAAAEWADKHNLSRPIKTRAIAPTGTIGIIGETTTGCEPLFCVAYKRRFLDTDMRWKFQYVIDPIAHHLIEEKGIEPGKIEDAYSLSYNVERRLRFQADLQGYVDHAIASTINLPYAITDEREVKQFGETLMEYLPRLRGITCYPDGTRAGQPLEAVPYEHAVGMTGVTFDDNRDDACKGGACGV
jgi:ribonucleoside-diphosphate reductase alpha chain